MQSSDGAGLNRTDSLRLVESESMKKCGILLVMAFLLMAPCLGWSVGIEGLSVRLSEDKMQLVGVRLYQAVPSLSSRVPSSVSHVDYRLLSGAAEIYVREGDAEIVDPDAPGVSVESIVDEDVGAFRVTGIICGNPERVVCGILLAQKAKEISPSVAAPRIYFSIRSSSRAEVARVIRDLIEGVSVRVGDMSEFRRINETEVKEIFLRIVGVLERSPAAPDAPSPAAPSRQLLPPSAPASVAPVR